MLVEKYEHKKHQGRDTSELIRENERLKLQVQTLQDLVLIQKENISLHQQEHTLKSVLNQINNGGMFQ